MEKKRVVWKENGQVHHREGHQEIPLVRGCALPSHWLRADAVCQMHFPGWLTWLHVRFSGDYRAETQQNDLVRPLGHHSARLHFRHPQGLLHQRSIIFLLFFANLLLKRRITVAKTSKLTLFLIKFRIPFRIRQLKWNWFWWKKNWWKIRVFCRFLVDVWKTR